MSDPIPNGRQAALAYRRMRMQGKGAKFEVIEPKPIINTNDAQPTSSASDTTSVSASSTRKSVVKKAAVQDTSRMCSKAYRQAQSNGKSAQKAFVNGSSSSAKVKAGNPNASSRDVAKQVRAERCTKGKCSATNTNGGSAKKTKRSSARDDAAIKDVTGTEVGSSDKLTGDAKGRCANVTGTEYVSEAQLASCNTGGNSNGGFSIKASVVASAKSGNTAVTSSSRSSQSTIVSPSGAANNSGSAQMTGVQTGGSQVTGGDKKSNNVITGTSGAARSGSTVIKPNTANVATINTSDITGDYSGNNTGITGTNNYGACQAVTGTSSTPRAIESCASEQQQEIKKRMAPSNASANVSGTKPDAIGLTGADKGVCSAVTGNEYQTSDACNTNHAVGDAEVMDNASRNKITGDGWDRGDKVTGTEGMWASSRNASIRGARVDAPMNASSFRPTHMDEVPPSPITGSSGNTDTGAKVTLSGGARA
jgi:hypothetical protein